jgi:hypothetical protein
MARRRVLGGISTVTTALGNILSASCSGTEELVRQYFGISLDKCETSNTVSFETGFAPNTLS